MININNALIMGAIYDPDTDCQFVIMRIPSKDWDNYQRELEKYNGRG